MRVLLALLLIGLTSLASAEHHERAAHGSVARRSLSSHGRNGELQLERRAKRSHKKGLGYNDVRLTLAFGRSVSWAYNWSASPGGQLNAGVRFVPMLWGRNTNGWRASATAAIASGSRHILAMNEPDLGSQANMSPAEAAALYKAQINPLRAVNIKAGSPAITNGGAPMGIAWMQSFLQACQGCKVDFIVMHWYDSASNTAYFKEYFTNAYKTFKKPIWITEFMGSGSPAQQEAFLREVLPWLEQQRFIQKYAAFGDFAGTFVNADGSLTSLGRVYRDTV